MAICSRCGDVYTLPTYTPYCSSGCVRESAKNVKVAYGDDVTYCPHDGVPFKGAGVNGYCCVRCYEQAQTGK
jgi:hypothetical protein